MMNTGRKYKLLYVQPHIPSYREDVVSSLAELFSLYILAELESKSGMGFSDCPKVDAAYIDCPVLPLFRRKVNFQSNLISATLSIKPDLILISANPRDLTYWLLLLISKILGITLLSHGQGLYRKASPSLVTRFMYGLMCLGSAKYIAYNEYAMRSMSAAYFSKGKLSYISNTIAKSTTVPFDNDVISDDSMGVLFLGRLRGMTGLQGLVEACSRLRKTFPEVVLHIVGDGRERAALQNASSEYDWVRFYGAIYDPQEIADISKKCRFACYPGSAGLSIVHFFSLGLPPVVFSDISQHMGPEPAYVVDAYNGILYQKEGGVDAIEDALRRGFSLSTVALSEMRQNAYKTYADLQKESFGDQLMRIVLNTPLGSRIKPSVDR